MAMTAEGIQSGHPDWFHPYGASMKVKRQGTRFLVLASDTASLRISLRRNDWLVEWTIGYHDATASGATVMSQEELRAAFGLSNYTSIWSRWMLQRWECDTAAEGKHIRSRNCLNVPGPGTGHEGDPNTSVFLTNEIRVAIDTLTGRNRKLPLFLRMGYNTTPIVVEHHVIA